MDFKTDKKLGMNSEFSIFDEIILDPDLVKTVNKINIFIQHVIHIYTVLSL